ncbi:hypothetical protein ANCDUO_23844 [Ancylostoma duodenale]|uniref:Uncharacterized protein n=1 Tax=Ancylostoma duodenale TaxID=51022 RepID=A0A0C2FC03_9BILA|nr:hypothetical protein ANCDUO_23844 [Ancylostoma duodenale]
MDAFIAPCSAVKVLLTEETKGNERRLNGSHLAPIEDKAYQFFGATVKSNKKHDKLIVSSLQP